MLHEMLSHAVFLALPSFKGIFDWLTGEAKYLIAGGLILILVIMIFTQKIKKYIGWIIVAALALFIVSDVFGFLDRVKEIFNLLFSGGE